MIRNFTLLTVWIVVYALVATLTAGGLVSCTTTAEKESLATCDAYGETLHALAVRRARGELSQKQIDKVNEVRPVLNEICLNGTPPKGSDPRAALQDGLDKLIEIKEREAMRK